MDSIFGNSAAFGARAALTEQIGQRPEKLEGVPVAEVSIPCAREFRPLQERGTDFADVRSLGRCEHRGKG